MTLMSFRSRFAALLLALIPLVSTASEPAIIPVARAYLAPEATLDAVRSVQYRGTLSTDDGKKTAIEIIFQKPLQHRVTNSGAEHMEVTALDDIEGWHQVFNSKGQGREMGLLDSRQIRRLRANTAENLGFFRPAGFRGECIDAGLVDLNGAKVHKIIFRHAADISFIRYFDPATGRLVLTETERGGTIREEGEILAGGIRFPKRMVMSSKMADGTTQSVVIEFESISVNETFANSLFAVPPLGR